MALADIDAAVTERRIQEIADSSRKAFEAHAQRSAEIDAASREAAAKEEADLKAAQERKAEVEARRAEAEAATRAAAKKAQEKPKFPPRPATLSLGAEEFRLDREARQVEKPQPEPQPEPEPPAREEPPRPNKTLKLGAREDDPDQGRPARKKSPRQQADDDLSGRTWLR